MCVFFSILITCLDTFPYFTSIDSICTVCTGYGHFEQPDVSHTVISAMLRCGGFEYEYIVTFSFSLSLSRSLSLCFLWPLHVAVWLPHLAACHTRRLSRRICILRSLCLHKHSTIITTNSLTDHAALLARML